MTSEEIFTRVAEGRLDKAAALQMLEAQRSASVKDVKPLADSASADSLVERVQNYLIGRLAETLELAEAEIDPEANLMDLGLDSTSLIRLAEQFEHELDITLYPTVFFEHQTLASVAAYFVEEYQDALRRNLTPGTL